MPCLIVILAVAFPRLAIILLWLFSSFFHSIHGLLIPVLGFLFLPLTLIVYTFFHNNGTALGPTQLVFLAIAAIVDLGLVGGSHGSYRRRVN